MATVTKYTITDYSDRIVFKETTGVYAANNTGGWGGLNEATTDAISATLFVGIPGKTELVELDLYPDFPSSTSAEIIIYASSLGLDKIYGGVYKFIYQVVTGTTTYETTKYYFLKGFTGQWFNEQIAGMDISMIGSLDNQVSPAPQNAWTDAFTRLERLWFLYQMACLKASKNYVNDAQCIMNYVNSKIKCC